MGILSARQQRGQHAGKAALEGAGISGTRGGLNRLPRVVILPAFKRKGDTEKEELVWQFRP